ncbi:aspartate/glutamate racemase family protein [Paenalcaligenes hominis]|uniref:maleate cis-trans isomerase family protein n=1 Tax=Paenalcaligenes hominis TaxID=643674 RepID=UPI003523E87B
MSIGFGHRSKIGQLYPSGGLCDFEIQLMAPEGVQFLTTRMPFKRSSLEDDIAFVKELETHAELLADAQVDLIAMNCTAASLIAGPEVVNQRIWSATGIPSVTTIEALMAAVQATGMQRVALMTPYVQEVVDKEVEYLTAGGYEVVTTLGKACQTPIEQGSLPPETWLNLSRQLQDDTRIDGLIISCAGIQVAPVLAQIEQELCIPVVTSNQALLWACLSLSGIMEPVTNYGDLLGGKFGSYGLTSKGQHSSKSQHHRQSTQCNK